MALETPAGLLQKAPKIGTGAGKRDGVLLALGSELNEARMETCKNAEKVHLDLKTKVVSFDIHKG